MHHAGGGGGILCREVPVLRWQPHDTVSASPLASSHRLMPSNHTMFRHKAARCSLSHAAPRAPASPLSLPSPAPRSWKAQAPRWPRVPTSNAHLPPCQGHSRAPCPHGVIPPGVIQAALPGDACRAPGRSCGEGTALAWRRLHPAVPASARGAHRAPWSPSRHPGHHPAGTGPHHAQCGSRQCRQPALQAQASSTPKEGLKIH